RPSRTWPTMFAWFTVDVVAGVAEGPRIAVARGGSGAGGGAAFDRPTVNVPPSTSTRRVPHLVQNFASPSYSDAQAGHLSALTSPPGPARRPWRDTAPRPRGQRGPRPSRLLRTDTPTHRRWPSP